EQGFDARRADLLTADLPPADVYLMAGSLYHFHLSLPILFDRIFERTDRLVLSEPVRNLSDQPGPIGWMARRAANPGDGHAQFRFGRQSLTAALDQERARIGFEWRVVSEDRDLLVEVTA